MIKMKLRALNHPTPDTVDPNDRRAFASTVLWLEDQKIRQYKIEDRQRLRGVGKLDEWEVGYSQYKADLGMPNFGTPLEELSWLLSFAIRLEFLDDPGKYKNYNAKRISAHQSKSAAPEMKTMNIFDDLDFNHKDFVDGVRALAQKLKIPHHPNHIMQLEAVARVVHDRLAPTAKTSQYQLDAPFPFEQGNDTMVPGDETLDYAARALRLLQIHSLRELQTRINETIVSIQNVTANPKTDTKLGKVGR